MEHSVPKIFSLTQESISPLCQTKWFRSPSCYVLNILPGVKCPECLKSETKEKLNLKRKQDNMMSPAKPNAPVSLTSSEQLKLALQSYRFKNKTLKEEI